MLFSQNLDICLDGKLIVNDSELTIEKKYKYGFIGPNGVGKTTVLTHIYNNIKDKFNVLIISQIENITSELNVYNYMLSTNEKLYDNYLITLNEDNDPDSYNSAIDYLELHDFHKYKTKIEMLLNNLGFIDNFDISVKMLSGGQQTKLALCKALLLEPELLLLDEPTNHLDLNNLNWLESYLESYNKCLILISHNINFIDTICDKIIYFFNIDHLNPQLFVCKGGYNNFLTCFNQKKNEYVKKYLDFIKKANGLKKNKKEYDAFLIKNHMNKPIRDYDINIIFEDIKSLSKSDYNNVISFNNVSFGYNENTDILKDIYIGISLKSRYIILGNNGSGKSTFFNLCCGKLEPTSGEIEKDARLRISYFNQHSVNDINNDLTPIQYLQYIDSNLDQQECRYILSKVGFKKMFEGDTYDIGKMKIGELSGGQKIKLILCGIQIQNPHIILFDEPTNHLDIISIQSLIDSINNFNGGVVIITHDKYIMNNIVDAEIFMCENKQITKLG